LNDTRPKPNIENKQAKNKNHQTKTKQQRLELTTCRPRHDESPITTFSCVRCRERWKHRAEGGRRDEEKSVGCLSGAGVIAEGSDADDGPHDESVETGQRGSKRRRDCHPA